MKLHLLVLVSAVALVPVSQGQAATLTWPGSGACAGTLESCIDSAISGDVVELATNGPVNEQISVDQSLTIRPALGFKPALATGRGVTGHSSAAGDFDVRIEGLHLNGGRIALSYSGTGQATFAAHRNQILGTSGQALTAL